MPIYEYACEKCESEFEVNQRITDDPVRICPRCKSKKIKRLISRTSFVLKGGGWYSDLYSSSGAKEDPVAKPDAGDAKTKSDPADSKSESKSESKSDSKSESKSESKAESKSADTPKAKDKAKGKGKRTSRKSVA